MITFSLPCLCDIPLNTPKCSDNQFGIIKNGNIICKSCMQLPTCASGLGVSIACGEIGTESHCVSCVRGKNFSSEYNNLPCQPCVSLSCHSNEKVLGVCSIVEDTSQCSGMCEKGYYSKQGYRSLDDCEPCSFCQNNNIRVQKCINDGLPFERQCEIGSLVPEVPTEKQKASSKDYGKRERPHHEGYKFYAHPAMFGSLVFLIVALIVGLVTVIVIFKRKFKNNKTNSMSAADNTVVPSGVVVGSGGNGGDSYKSTRDLDPVYPAVRNRKSSSSAGQKVSFNRQNSHSQAVSDMNEGRISPDELTAEHADTFEEKQSLSNSSGRRNRSFTRQISNPEAEHKNEKPLHKRSQTFSSFTGLLSSQKNGGTAEETASLMTSTDCNYNDIFLPEVVALTAPQRLSGVKVGHINAGIYSQLCKKLNRPDIDNNWIKLAGCMGYTADQMKNFEGSDNPADKLLQNWKIQPGHDVASLINLLKEINRDDIVELLECHRDTDMFYIGQTGPEDLT